MTSKADFTEEEWTRLKRAPFLAGIAQRIEDEKEGNQGAEDEHPELVHRWILRPRLGSRACRKP